MYGDSREEEDDNEEEEEDEEDEEDEEIAYSFVVNSYKMFKVN